MGNTASTPAAISPSTHAAEIGEGQRFEFGANWRRFLDHLTDERIAIAKQSILELLRLDSLDGLTFLDAGSGSSLFSLCARQLGATVVSFDFDPAAVGCARELKRRYFPDDDRWTIHEGSVLDREFLADLGEFDIVYSWGVLHHTGGMWAAIGNVAERVKPGGRFVLSIYNDQGDTSRRWTLIKKIYNRYRLLRWPLLLFFGAYFEGRAALGQLARLRNPLPFRRWREYKNDRGMSVWHDIVDWVGGYPFEVAKPEEIFDFLHARHFDLLKLKTCAGRLGCNEFTFRKCTGDAPST